MKRPSKVFEAPPGPDPNRKPWEIPVGGGEYGIDLEVYFSLLEQEIDYTIIACDVEEDNLVYGDEHIERLDEMDEDEVVRRTHVERPILSEEHKRRIQEAEEELGYRLVCYHVASNWVVWGGDMLDELEDKEGV